MRKVLAVVVGLAISMGTLIAAVRLVHPAQDPGSVRRQLTFLRSALDDGAATEAQRLFPEGYFFSYALYGLAAVDVGLGEPPGERADELGAARWALDRLESDEGRAPFPAAQQPAYGVFYRGWTNWLRGGILLLQPEPDPAEARRFQRDSADLAAAFDAAGSPFLTAYPGQAWPCDSTVAVASLRLHDRLFAPRHAGTVERWLSGVRERLDPATGLMPHRADPLSGEPLEGARATSLSIITRFLVDVSPEFGREQYLLYRDKFRASIPAMREYPAGVSGAGDVDSGPLVFGVSLSATAVTLGAARVHGDSRLAGALTALSEVAGAPVDLFGTRRYAGGALPIGDAFVAWSRSARPWVADAPPAVEPDLPAWWRAPLIAVLLLIGLLPWLPRLLRRRSGRSRPTPGPPSVTRRPARSAP